MLIVDFETRSRIDLIDRGAYIYAQDLSTDIFCCSFRTVTKIGAPETFMWRNPAFYPSGLCKPLPERLLKLLENPDCLVAAHNAQFDKLIWDFIAEPDYGFPMIEYNRWYCTSAMCRVNALPAKLDDATRCINAKHKKDHRGAALIRQLSIPGKDGTFDENPDALLEMASYCQADTAATLDLIRACRPMTQNEHLDWLINEDINERGIHVDIELATLATQYATAEQDEIAAELSRLTAGVITKHTQTARIAKFTRETLEANGIPTTVMVRYKKNVKKYSIDKSVRAELMDRVDELGIPDKLYDVLLLTDDGNRSSVSKFKRMLARTDPDTGRACGSFVYAGASQTLRYASRGLQLHNMRRDCWSEGSTQEIKRDMQAGKPLDNGKMTVMNTLSKLLRPALIPADGHQFVVGDWSAIEAMVLPWLANSRGGEAVLDIFREGKDIYIETGKRMNIDDRQINKVVVLALGFGGANGAFNSMARNYGLHLPEDRVTQIVKRWRKENAWAVDFWHRLHKAATKAIKYPGTEFDVGRVKYLFAPALLGGTLLCRMPGDTVIQYPQARVEMVEGKHGRRAEITAIKASWTMAADATEWPRFTLWHGLLAENATQAFAARILRNGIKRCHLQISMADVVMHVHDEIVLEAPTSEAYGVSLALEELMNNPPAWAEGLPLSAKPKIMNRYGK